MRRAAFLLLLASSACRTESSCFVRGTLVRTPSGKVPIEALRVGDTVLAFRADDGAVVVRAVREVHRSVVDRVRVLRIEGSDIVTTDEHPFWEAERRMWSAACDLDAGAVVARYLDDGSVRPANVESAYDETRPATEVWNLGVDGPEHTFFAGDVAVHNKSFPPDPELAPLKIVNRTAEPVAVSLRVTELAIVERFLDASPSIRLRPDTFGVDVDTISLSRGEMAALYNSVTVVSESGADQVPGVILGLGTGAQFLVVGEGRVHLERSGDEIVPRGEPEQHVIRIDAGECTAAETPSMGPRPAIDVSYFQSGEIIDQTKKNGCFAVTLKRPKIPTPLDVDFCVPAGAWPFVVGDSLTFGEERTDDSWALSLSNDAARLEIRSSRVPTQTIGGEKFTVAQSPECVTTETECGMPRVPVRLFREGETKPIPLRLETQTLDGTKLWVFGGEVQQVMAPRCTRHWPSEAVDYVTLRRLR